MLRTSLVLALLVMACPGQQPVRSTPCTEVEATRCSDTVVEICNAASQWEAVIDCRHVSPDEGAWQCVYDDQEGTHTCQGDSHEP